MTDSDVPILTSDLVMTDGMFGTVTQSMWIIPSNVDVILLDSSFDTYPSYITFNSREVKL